MTARPSYRHAIPIRTAAAYVLVAILWILGSDYLLGLMTNDVQLLRGLQTGKGIAFVVVTGGLLYAMLYQQIKTMERLRSEQQKAEELLDEVERLYSLLFMNSGEAVLLTTENGIVLSVNPSACAMFQCAEVDIRHMPLSQFIDPSDPSAQEVLGKHTNRTSHYAEISMKRHNGAFFPAEWSDALFVDHFGVPRRNVILRDLTERKKAEQELMRFHEMLERRVEERTAELNTVNNELESFNYSVSHDLRAPIRAIDGFAAMLMEDHQGELTQDQHQLITHIRTNTKRMDQLINGLLSISRLGRQELNLEAVSMNAMVTEVLTEVLPPATKDRYRISQDEMPVVECDRVLMRQVWHNLLSNAVKYSAKSEQPFIHIGTCRTDGGMLEFSVHDNGVGFDQQKAEHLFGIFQRLHSAAEFDGIGVGLSIVKRIVHRHGGMVSGEGRRGEGAVFRFTLPPSCRITSV